MRGIHMKTAVLLCSFGTSYAGARERSLDRIFQEIRELAAKEGISCRQAYTSGMILKKLAGERIFIPDMKEALDEILEEGAEHLIVVPTHMLAGLEYEKLKKEVDRCRGNFKKTDITTAVLDREEDLRKLLPVLQEIYGFREDQAYLLMGHGSEADANIRYAQMNQVFGEAGLTNVRIASVEAKPDLEDAIEYFSEHFTGKKVVLHPFMVVAGDHAHNDMAGEKNSYAARLLEEGYQVETCIRGLGEYPAFRKIYMEKLQKVLRG